MTDEQRERVHTFVDVLHDAVTDLTTAIKKSDASTAAAVINNVAIEAGAAVRDLESA